MPLTAIGDLSRNIMLRQANLGTKTELATRIRELTTGVRSDIPAAVAGDTRQLTRIESRLNILASLDRSATELVHRTDSMQRSLEAVQSIAQSLGTSLVQVGTTPSRESLAATTVQARQQLADVGQLLNTAVGGRHLFSGTRVDTPPLPPVDALLAAARSAAGSAATSGDLIAAVGAFFDAAPGGGGFADSVYQGDTSAQVAAIAPGQTLPIDIQAVSPAIRQTLKGMTLLALSAEAPWAGDLHEQARIVAAAGEALIIADTGLSLLRGDLGATEAGIARAQSRNAAETTALMLARNDLVAADQYEAASAVAEAEARMEAIYSLTARMSRLSLAAYL